MSSSITEIWECEACGSQIRITAGCAPTFSQLQIDCECTGFNEFEWKRTVR